MNVTRHPIDHLPSVAAGASCYAAFCYLAHEPYPSPTADRIDSWGIFFNTGATCLIYVSHLEKECRILGLDTSRMGEGVYESIKELGGSQIFVNQFGNFILRDISVALMRSACLERPIAQMVYVAFISPLRGRSGTLPARLAKLAGEMSSMSKPTSKSFWACATLWSESD